jgi:MSHA biogenesis protein MshQ
MMSRIATVPFAFLLAAVLGLLLLACGLPARADTPVSLFQSFRGNVNFVGTEEVLRTKNNADPCSLVKNGTVIYANLSGIPSGATIKSAQLYWAGSGTTADYTVTFDGVTVTAPTKPTSRQYIAKAVANNTTYTYFSGAADVTTQVAKKGNGYYSFSGLKVNNGSPWCAVQGVVGGFALVVVYSHPNEPFRMLNLYEGFQDFQNTSLKIDLGDFNVPNPLPTNVTGRVGHITWEGDQTLSQGGEDLLFNGYEMTDKYPNSSTWFNPPGNQFNSASNVTGDSTSYGVDFDIYTLRSPVIQPGQRTATTTYRSGQDLVILSAEIVAMPYVANADLALAMTRSGDLTVGSQSSYTLTVTNGGVDDEMGPVTVVDTLPAGLKLDSASGTGWSCTNVKGSTQTVVTCTQAGPVKSGAKMSPIVIKVTPSAAGNYTNSATVSGKTGDDNSKNNTATNAAAVADSGAAASLVLTSEACAVGARIVSGDDEAGCHTFSGPVVAAAANTVIYITSVSTVNGQQMASKKSDANYPLSVDFKFGCAPNSSVAITYATVGFDCVGTWKTVSAKLPAGQASAVVNDAANSALAFKYADVGRLSMTMRYNGTVSGTVDFVSRPQDIRFVEVLRADGYADQQGTIDNNPGWAKPDIGFAKAGEQFSMRLCARMADGVCARSFGKEQPESADFDFQLDLFAVNLKGTPKLPITSNEKDRVVREAFVLDQEFTRSTQYPGSYVAQARWFEAGMLGITPRLTDYLGTGQVGGLTAEPDAAGRLVGGTRVVGRFYPDHFETEATANLDCVPEMNCPTADSIRVRGATYSMQPFSFSVKAYGLPKTSGGDPTLLALYQNLIINPAQPRPLTLTASKAPNVSQVPDVGRFDTDPSAQLAPPATADDYPDLGGKATWRLGDPYDPAKRTVNTWGAPTAVYLRASMKEFRGTGTGTAYAEENVTSLTPTTAPAGTRYEDGLVVVAGRLFVQNVFGSDLLRLPVPLAAQYWNGSAWLASSKDDNTVASGIKPVLNSCRRSFAQDLKTGACIATPLRAAASAPVRLKDGKGTLLLLDPPRGTVGSVDYTLDSAAAPWLPSTQARATFGLYKSPLIYLREVY